MGLSVQPTAGWDNHLREQLPAYGPRLLQALIQLGDGKLSFVFQIPVNRHQGQFLLHFYLQKKSIQVTQILTCAIDGAPTVGKCGFTPHILTVHCVLHRHNLVAKSESPPLCKSPNVIKQNKSPCPDCSHTCVRNTMTHLSVFFSILMSASSLLGAVCGVPGGGW